MFEDARWAFQELLSKVRQVKLSWDGGPGLESPKVRKVGGAKAMTRTLPLPPSSSRALQPGWRQLLCQEKGRLPDERGFLKTPGLTV